MIAFSLLLMSCISFADVSVPDYDWSVADVSQRNISKESMFQAMDRKYIKLGSSICANRALMWVKDFKMKYNVDAAKIFLFYTSKSNGAGNKQWWYHVAPVVADKGELFVMDAGFSYIKGPQKIQEWLATFNRVPNCKEISANDSDLVQLMNEAHQFPTQTQHGNYNCYYKVVPAGLWFPYSVAASLSGENIPNEIQANQVYSACIEAVTTSLGRVFGGGKKTCRKYLE